MTAKAPKVIGSPPAYDIADAAALQAVGHGTASEDQQRRALNWIIIQAAKTYDPEYQPDARDHAYASGRRSVGLNIVTMLKLDLAAMRQLAPRADK